MDNLLLKYFVENYEKVSKKNSEPGPVITISREHGCSAKEIGQILVEKINKKDRKKTKKPEWKYFGKEILYEASKELRIYPEQLKKLLNSEEKDFIEEIVASFTDKYYVHNARIIGVMKRVIKKIANKGSVVIVGRAGVAITKDISKSLHVHLQAPLQWRIENIKRKRNNSIEEAKAEVIEIDMNRSHIINLVNKGKSDITKYDLILNCKTFNPEEICEIILNAAEKRNLL